MALAALMAGAAVAAGVGLLIGAIVTLHHDTDAASRSQQVLIDLSRTERLTVDLETGVRGYVITRESAFLAPYDGARLALPQTLAQLRTAVAGDAPDRAATARLARQISDYVSHYSATVIAEVRRDPAATRTTAITAAGKSRVDAIRSTIDGLRRGETIRQAVRQRQARRSSRRAVTEGIAVLVILVIVVALFAVTASRLLMSRERARRGAAFLAEAGALLDAPLDLDETLGAFSRLAVPALADWCAVELFDEHGAMRTVAVAHRDPGRSEEARRVHERLPLRRIVTDADGGGSHRGRAALLATVTERHLRSGAAEEQELRAAQALRIRSAMVVPLIARGRELGAVTFVTGQSGRTYDRDDLARAQELGRRVALAVDTARLLRRSEETASVLQASLLPQALPDVPGFELEARFLPAGEGTLVGGDFFDVFTVGPGRWALVVGDVCGKGAPAAALTGMARYTLRALASERLSPSAALERLNATLLQQDLDHRFITMAYATLQLPEDPRAGAARVQLACAGHPPPILWRPPAHSEPLAAEGRLLGIWPELELTEVSFDLAHGDALVLYSDGVTDQGAGRGQLPEDLARHVAGAGARDAAQLADAVQQAALGGGAPQRDDVAILAVRRLPAAPPARPETRRMSARL